MSNFFLSFLRYFFALLLKFCFQALALVECCFAVCFSCCFSKLEIFVRKYFEILNLLVGVVVAVLIGWFWQEYETKIALSWPFLLLLVCNYLQSVVDVFSFVSASFATAPVFYDFIKFIFISICKRNRNHIKIK